jgi:hypothetical protein
MICLSTFFLTLTLQAQNAQIYFENAQAPGLSCAKYRQSTSPIFKEVFTSSAAHAAVQDVSFILTNQLSKSIIGLAFKYRIIDANANETTYVLKTHSYLLSSLAPLAAPGEQLLVSPDSVFSESLIRSGHGLAGTLPRQRTISQFSSASRIYIAIDAVIFDDGEVIGVNELQLAQSMQHYKEAADILERQIQSARVSHQDVHTSLALLQSTPRPSTDPAGKHLSHLLHLLISATDFESAHNYILRLRAQPKLFRKDGLPL